MIKLVVEEYCEDCPEFSPVVDKDDFYADDVIRATNTVITCEHASRCGIIYDYLLTKSNRGKVNENNIR